MTAGRNSRGQFVKGNRHSVDNKGGRPPRAKEEKYMAAFTRGVSLEDWEKATRAVLKEALKGNVSAWKALAPYSVGLPMQSHEVKEVVMTVEEWRESAQERLAQVEDL